MTKEFTREEKLVIGAAPAPAGMVIVLGMPEAGWNAMADGRTHTADLSKIGIPVQVVVMRGRDRIAIAAEFGDVNAVLGKEPRNLGIDDPDKAIADRVVQDVCELPDRDSPEGWPEALIVTTEELHLIVTRALEASR